MMIGGSAAVTVILGALLIGFGPLISRADDGGGGLKTGDTLRGMRARPKAPFVRRRPLDSNLFDPQALARYGK